MDQHMTSSVTLPVTSRLLLIDGKWQKAASGKSFDTFDPSTGQCIARLAEGSSCDVDAAVLAARKAFDGVWRKFKPFDRQALLLKFADLVEANFDELAQIETIDMGAPISRTSALKRRCIALIRFYAGLATAMHGETIENSIPGDVFTYTLKEPVGVVGAIVPWNSPLTLGIWKISPALTCGCTVILKPAEQASLSLLRLGELICEAGFPPGVFNIVTGSGEAGAALAAHPGVDKIAFTGSTETGQAIIRASAGNIKRLSLELGGKSANIVFADADLDAAAAGAAAAVFSNSGQMCIAGARLYVERAIHDEFVARVAEHGAKLRFGPTLDPQTDIGPLISAEQLNRVVNYIGLGTREGARLVSGGHRLSTGEFAGGYFVPPTVFSGVTDDMAIAREEIFGPVISAMPFTDIDDVIARANNTAFGLGGGVWTRDVGKAHRIAGELRTGTVWVNCYLPMDPAVPFGGYKMSGYGRESGVRHLDEFLNVKSVVLKTT